jgi:hypothetical protein
MLREPLSDAVAAKQVRTTCQFWATSDNVNLANLADELICLAQQLVLLYLDLFWLYVLPYLALGVVCFG